MRHSISTIHNINTSSNDKNELNLYRRGLLYKKTNTYLDKSHPFKNKSVAKIKKSTVSVIKWRNNYKSDYWILEQKTQNRERNRLCNNKLRSVLFSSIKYRTVRFRGCKRPIFMFINRSSNKDRTILRDLNYIIMDNILHFIHLNNQHGLNKINSIHLNVLNNYSLI